MIHWHKQAIILFIALVFAIACQGSDGEGQIHGVLKIPSCGIDDDHFHHNLNAFAADYFQNTLSIRIQSSGRVPTFSDGLFLVIRDARAMSGFPPGTKHLVEVSPEIAAFKDHGSGAGYPATTPESPARVSFYLNETCPENRLAFTDGGGILAMDSVYIPGETRRIKGYFELEFIDPRHWEDPENPGPYAQIEGDFDFKYNPRKTATTFP